MREKKASKSSTPYIQRLLVLSGDKFWALNIECLPYGKNSKCGNLPDPEQLDIPTPIVAFLPINTFQEIPPKNIFIGNYLTFLSYKGGIQMFRFLFGEVVDRARIRPSSTWENIKLTKSHPLKFLRYDESYLLFLNTGHDIERADLTPILKKGVDLAPIPFQNIGIKTSTIIANPMFFYAFTPNISYLLIPVLEAKKLEIKTYNLVENQLVEPSIVPEINNIYWLQTISLEWVVDNSAEAQHGKPYLRLVYLDESQGTFFEDAIVTAFSFWDDQKKKFENWYGSGGADKNLGDVLWPPFVWPISRFDDVNPNRREHDFHVVMSKSTVFVQRNKGVINHIFNTPTHSNVTFGAYVTNTNEEDFLFTGHMQREYWCWAAASASILNFYRKADPLWLFTSQCQVASTVRADSCCVEESLLSAKCKDGGESVSNVLEKNFSYKKRDLQKFSFDHVKQEINNNNIIVASRTQKHAVLIVGYAHDPTVPYAGMDWLLVWNPTGKQMHGLRYVLFDIFAKSNKAALATIRDPMRQSLERIKKI